MMNEKGNAIVNKLSSLFLGRRSAMRLIGLGLLVPMVACGEEDNKMKNEIILNVVMNSYVDRVHTNIFFNNTDLGVTTKFGTTGTVASVRIPFGIQTLEWTLGGPKGTPDNGKLVKIRNQLLISAGQIPPGTRYLGLHLYSDDTAEISFSESIPEISERGKKILASRR